MRISKEKKVNDYEAFRQLFGGLDSNVRLLEDEFGVEVPDEQIENFHTVGDVVRYVEENS